MDQLISSLVSSAPSVIGGIVVLVLMLKHLDTRETAIKEITGTFVQSMKEQADSCHNIQQDSIAVMRENTKVLAELRTTVQATDVTLREVRTKLAKAVVTE